MIEERPLIDIVRDVIIAREIKVSLKWTPEEIASDILFTVKS
jgi:hypothetical protein